MTEFSSTLHKITAWMQRHFDAALMLAAAVEIPRWTVTFLAIHEPLWVGVPLGALLAYAASEGWKGYFADKRRWFLLCFNVVSLCAATFVITPVLYAMASGPVEQLDLTRILPPQWLAAWAGVLAVTTFAPLIQLAAVKAAPRNAAHAPDAAPAATATVQTAQNDAAHAPDAVTALRATDDIVALQPPARAVALQMADEGVPVQQIAAQVGAKPATVRSWLRRAKAQTNGGQP